MAIRRVPISVSIDADLWDRVKKLAADQDVRRSVVVNDLIRDAIDQHELVAKATTDPVLMGAFARALAEPGVLRTLGTTLRADMTDEQLELFKSSLAGVAAAGVIDQQKQRTKAPAGSKRGHRRRRSA